MSVASCFIRRPVAAGLILFLSMPLAQAAAAQQPQATAGQPTQDAPAPQNQVSQNQTPASPSSAQQAPAASPQPAQDSPQSSPEKPVGTAAAPAESPTGVTASRPAGAVIAPAKQKRVRAILISVGVIVAAAVAVGCVVGLSKSSPARPN
jgi:cytoskeletal protein RodZ